MYDRIKITPANLAAIKARYRYVGFGQDETPPLNKDEFYILTFYPAVCGGAVALVIAETFDEMITTEDLELLSQVSV